MVTLAKININTIQLTLWLSYKVSWLANCDQDLLYYIDSEMITSWSQIPNFTYIVTLTFKYGLARTRHSLDKVSVVANVRGKHQQIKFSTI